MYRRSALLQTENVSAKGIQYLKIHIINGLVMSRITGNRMHNVNNTKLYIYSERSSRSLRSGLTDDIVLDFLVDVRQPVCDHL